VITPNFYKLFLSLNPNYICSKGELQILIALTQFMPRVLEQIYLDHYKPELNGNKLKNYQVIFNFLNWSSSSLSSSFLFGDSLLKVNNSDDTNVTTFLGKGEYPQYIAKDEFNNIVSGSNSMNGLSSLLGISIQGLKYHLNRESFVLAKSLGLNVSIQENNIIPKGSPIEYYRTKQKSRPNLNLSKELSSLEMGNIFIYALDKETVIAKKATAPLVFKYLNPRLSLKLNSKELKSKADNMATYINKESIYYSELGNYYLAKNPNYAINVKSSIVIINLDNYKGTICNSKRECAKILSQKLDNNIQLGTISRKNWLDSGIIIKNNDQERYLLLSKSLLITLISESDSEFGLQIERNRTKAEIKEILNSNLVSNNATKEIAIKSLDLKKFAKFIDNYIISSDQSR
jgi:hypothetical protein